MKTLLLASLFVSLNSFATTFIVEMKKPLTTKELAQAKKKGFSVELFDLTQTEYFKKTYRIEAANQAVVTKHFPSVTVETINKAMHFSLEAKAGSVFTRPDELFHLQWGLQNQEQMIKKLINNTKEETVYGKKGVDIRWADSIKKIEIGMKKDPLVAVIDMGVDLDHPEIKGRLFKNTIECNEKGEIFDSEDDKDKNGLKGDCMGWNFAGRSMQEARRPYDDVGHGTHVAGIIAAESNKEGISGVSSRIKILPIKVTGLIDSSSDKKNVQPLTDRIAKGILYATNMGADVINLSLGWTRSMDTKYLNEAIEYALSRNVIIVAAAGNNNNNATILPCSHYDVICVGAATIDGSLAEFSNYGGEVDVIAPGDEIVSLIPTQIVPVQLNLQGYDILSGTSQAAPFVSATAALLRGNFPRMHRDEVTRRIVDSSDPAVPGKSLGGMLNLKGAFEIEALPSVRPTFKNFAVALYDGTTKKFVYTLQVKNFGFEAKDVVVKVASKSDSLQLAQDYTLPLIRPGEVLSVRLEGLIVDDNAHNQVKLEVSIAIPNLAQKTFQHEFRIARDILKDDKITTVPFSFQAAALQVGTFKDNLAKNNINTVEVLSPETGLPEYYLPRIVKESNVLELKIFRAEESTLKEVAGAINLPGATQLMNVTKMDLNYDGQFDYLVRAVACDKNCDDAAKAAKYIQYSLWSKDLKPLLGEGKSVWKFLPIMFNVDLKSQRFLKVNTKEFGPLALPAFIELGRIPADQQVVPAFSKPDATVSRRVYYLDPIANTEGKVELVTHTLSTVDFVQNIRTTTKASQADEIHVLFLMNQTKADLKVGRVNAMISIGKGYLRQNIMATLGGEAINLRPYEITQNLLGYEHLNSLNLDTQDTSDSFTGLASRSRLVMFQNAKSYTYSSADSVENALGTIASFNDQNNEYTFFQTPSYLVLAHNSASGTELAQMKINRFSFLPGTLFNDSFFPVFAKTNGVIAPGLYVDETDIQSNIVSFTVVDNGHLKSPIRQSAYIPPICKAVNPVRLASDEGHSLTMLCFENTKWVMKFVRLNQ